MIEVYEECRRVKELLCSLGGEWMWRFVEEGQKAQDLE